MKKNRLLVITIAMLMSVLMLTMVGCDDSMMQMLQMYTAETETLEEGQSIYEHSMYDSLPSDHADIDPLFWEVEGEDGNKVYFFGSIHVADDSAYRLPKKIMDAYLESDSLAVECDINAIQTDFMAQMQLAQYLAYTDGTTIQDHLSPELYEEMCNFYNEYMSEMASGLGYNLETLNSMKPAVWMSLFENYFVEQSGLSSELGIDSHFLTLAAAQGREIIEIESAQFQYAMLDGFSDELFEMQLSGYVQTDPEEYAKVYRDMYEGWKVGDPKDMMTTETDYSGLSDEEVEFYSELIDEYNTAMLTDRNIGMADAAEKMINGGQNVFYVVGCGHFVGNGSVIDLLIERGYDVKQIGGQDAEPYMDMDELPLSMLDDADTPSVSDDDEEEAQSTADTEYDYDLYVEMYEYFGGTTADTEDDVTTAKTSKTTKKTTKKTTARTTNSGGWGGWGSSD